jgi:hypothetical protein
VDSLTKDPVKVRAGTIGARARWDGHDSKIVRLGDLTSEQRRLVLALISAARENAKAAPASETPGAAMEASGASRRRPTAA